MDPSPRTHKTPEVTPKTIGRLIHMMKQILIQERYSIRLTMPLATFTPELYSFAKKIRSQCTMTSMKLILQIYSNCVYLRLHFCKCRIFSSWCNLYLLLRMMTDGFILGVLTFLLQPKSTEYLLVMKRFIPLTSGSRKANVNWNIESSFGYWSKTDRALETYWEGKTCTWTNSCALCNLSVEEWVHHHFVDCPFARICWDILHIDIPLNCSFPELFTQIKIQLNSQFSTEAAILLCWTIWTARNELLFKGNSLNLIGCRGIFFNELKLLKHRMKTNQLNQFSSWIQSLE